MKIRLFLASLASIVALSMIPGAAFAHVVVKPVETTVGSFDTYTVSVPNEKEIAVTSVRLQIPKGLSYVTPTTKPEWSIDVEKDGDVVRNITWKDGTIPAGQRQDFTFSAQAPAAAGHMTWKAYQTYADGTVVAWDKAPTNSDIEGENSGPFSVTNIKDDTEEAKVAVTAAPNTTLALIISIVAVVLSAASLFIRKR
jgi:uncharacterized protein YcnI